MMMKESIMELPESQTGPFNPGAHLHPSFGLQSFIPIQPFSVLEQCPLHFESYLSGPQPE